MSNPEVKKSHDLLRNSTIVAILAILLLLFNISIISTIANSANNIILANFYILANIMSTIRLTYSIHK